MSWPPGASDIIIWPPALTQPRDGRTDRVLQCPLRARGRAGQWTDTTLPISPHPPESTVQGHRGCGLSPCPTHRRQAAEARRMECLPGCGGAARQQANGQKSPLGAASSPHGNEPTAGPRAGLLLSTSGLGRGRAVLSLCARTSKPWARKDAEPRPRVCCTAPGRHHGQAPQSPQAKGWLTGPRAELGSGLASLHPKALSRREAH